MGAPFWTVLGGALPPPTGLQSTDFGGGAFRREDLLDLLVGGFVKFVSNCIILRRTYGLWGRRAKCGGLENINRLMKDQRMCCLNMTRKLPITAVCLWNWPLIFILFLGGQSPHSIFLWGCQPNVSWWPIQGKQKQDKWEHAHLEVAFDFGIDLFWGQHPYCICFLGC